ncbi:MAG: universal stress protein [Thermodesulfobacteriota bacterium]
MLLADDGSEGAARARDFALTLAAATGARLTAVYVKEPAESDPEARRKLAPTRAEAAAAGVKCRVVIARPVGITNPGRRILDAAHRQRADLIVVGARGAGLTRKLLGSVSSHVASRARGSVCVIR